MIIGITGTIGSGKGTVVSLLKEKGFAHYSSSATLGELLAKRGLAKVRENLSPLATELQSTYGGGVVGMNYKEKYLVEAPENAIFEALHRVSEAKFIQSVGGIVIGVDADFSTRFDRISHRHEGEKDEVTFDDWKKQVEIEENGGGDSTRDNNIRAVLSIADVVIDNNGTPEDLAHQVNSFIHNHSSSL
jgi:dephospho-CoA kinase